MKRRVALIEFSIYDQIPLVSGYLHSYALADPCIAHDFEFVYCTRQIERISYDEALDAVRALKASIVCLSCYVWNMGLIKRLIHDLSATPHIERIILGGHQVSHHITNYVGRSDSKSLVINGQGEVPFRQVLLRISDSKELAGLRGVSLYMDGELSNGGEADVVANLDDIPSPFLGGQFDRMAHPITVYETNRGCPYKCTFCTWGGDTFKVAKFSTERIKEELLWLVKKPLLCIFIGDANWGMLPRDVDISEHIARLKRTYGFPLMVYYAAAKNKPRGSVACIEKFHEGGVITSQALGIQSLNDVTLEKIDRKNIKLDAYFAMFEHLKARGIDSYCELIWPLPGETLETLKAGFSRLLGMGAPTIIMYPSILINNARLTNEVGQHGIEADLMKDWRSELRVVKKTATADRVAVDDGFWFYYAYYLLANWDLNKGLLHYVRAASHMECATTVTRFAEYLRANVGRSQYARKIQEIFDGDAHGDLMILGRLATHICYEARFSAQRDVAEFMVKEVAGDRLCLLAALTIWGYSLPKLFANRLPNEENLLEFLVGLAATPRAYRDIANNMSVNRSEVSLQIDDAERVWSDVLRFFNVSTPCRAAETRYVMRIDRPGATLGYNPDDPNRNEVYAHGMTLRLRHISARVSVA